MDEEEASALSCLKGGLNMAEVLRSWTRDQMRTFVGSLGCEKVSWKREHLQDQIQAVLEAFQGGSQGTEDLKGIAESVAHRPTTADGSGGPKAAAAEVPTKVERGTLEDGADSRGVQENKEGGEAEELQRRNRKRAKNIKNALTCHLCQDLFIEATTITECLHTFCRACIIPKIKVGTNANTCPYCGIPIAPDPFTCKQIIFDRTLDDIVTKLFPREGDLKRSKLREQRSLEEQEMKRRLKLQAGVKRPRLNPPALKRQASSDLPPQPSTSQPAGAALAADTVMKIRIDKGEGSKYPQLRKCFFKVYPNVTIKTLRNHVVKRLEKVLGGQKIPPDQIPELYTPMTHGDMNVSRKPISDDVSIEKLYQSILLIRQNQSGEEGMSRLQPDKDNSLFALEYRERHRESPNQEQKLTEAPALEAEVKVEGEAKESRDEKVLKPSADTLVAMGFPRGFSP